jgi:indolepyruvate ferredoxin oxidoreductase, beta subunit
MKVDIMLAGVGGQGVLSLAALIGRAAVAEGLQVKQSEVHGMAQRGGAVLSHLRLSDHVIASDLIPLGTADLILSMEPLESLRYVAYLSPTATVVTSVDPFINIPDYPAMEEIIARLRRLPRAVLVEAERLAREAGDVLSKNTVMVGAAAHLLPLKRDSFEGAIRQTFGAKGDRALEVNFAAFEAGGRVSA